MKAQLLKPGFMIALASSLKGGVQYQTIHEESDKSSDGALTEKWETTKTVFDAAEHDRAVKVRGAAQYQVRRLCVVTPFCLLCPESAEGELDIGVEIAKKIVDDFNATAVYTRINFYVLKARLLGNDESTAKAIAGEMRSLLSEMGDAIQKMDPEAIREALTKANQVSEMLVEEQQEKVSLAIELARKAAREITKNLKNKAGGALSTVEDFRVQLLAVEKAKQVFLDFEESSELTAEQEAPAVQMRELDLSEGESSVKVPVFVPPTF